MRASLLSGALNNLGPRRNVISLWPTPVTRLNLSAHYNRCHLYYNHYLRHQVSCTYRTLGRWRQGTNDNLIRGVRLLGEDQHQCRFLTTSVRDNEDEIHKGKRQQEQEQQRQQQRQVQRVRARSGALVLGRHVKEALANGSPIVALESTVITHGLPEPHNLELALRLEAEICEGRWWRDPTDIGCSSSSSSSSSSIRGIGSELGRQQQQQQEPPDDTFSGVVTPATIGIVKGQLVIGLSRDEIEYLATRAASHPIKASRRDLPIAMALGLSAGTTVSATMAVATSLQAAICRQLANSTSAIIDHNHLRASDRWAPSGDHQRAPGRGGGRGGGHSRAIKVFATGGMGGVHLGGETSMDISADLYEFARSPIGLVSSGFKSFLDTRRSLEFLETMGCTVTSLRAYKSTYEACRSSSSSSSSSCSSPDDKGAYLSSRLSENLTIPAKDTSENHNDNDNNDHNSQSAIQLRQRLAKGHQFPGFFTTTNKEQVKSPWQCGSVQEAAQILFECLEGPMFLGGARATCATNGSAPNEGIFNLANSYESRAMLLACPIPADFSLDNDDQQYRQAMEAISSSIDGRLDLNGAEKTPLILAQLNEATGGKTLRANIELLRNNARIGAHLAYEYGLLADRTGAILPPADMIKGAPATTDGQTLAKSDGPNSDGLVDHDQQRQEEPSPVVVVGCTMIDMHVSTKIDDQFKNNPNHSGVTFEGRPHLTVGGVGRNLATAIQLLGHRPTFITCLGGDNLGKFAQDELAKCELRQRLKLVEADASTDTCFALVLMDSLSGQCEFVVANLEANKRIDPTSLIKFMEQQQQPKLVVVDANLPSQSLEYLLAFGQANRVPVFVEPTDVVCLGRLVDCLINSEASSLAFMSPNVIELSEMLHLFESRKARLSNFVETTTTTTPKRTDASKVTREQVELMATTLMEKHLCGLKCLLVTMDKRGVLMAVRVDEDEEEDDKEDDTHWLPRGGKNDDTQQQQQLLGQINLMDEIDKSSRWWSSAASSLPRPSSRVVTEHFETPNVVERPVSASGAGDSFAAGFISGLLDGLDLSGCVQKGFRASYLALQARDTISGELRRLR